MFYGKKKKKNYIYIKINKYIRMRNIMETDQCCTEHWEIMFSS